MDSDEGNEDNATCMTRKEFGISAAYSAMGMPFCAQMRRVFCE